MDAREIEALNKSASELTSTLRRIDENIDRIARRAVEGFREGAGYVEDFGDQLQHIDDDLHNLGRSAEETAAEIGDAFEEAGERATKAGRKAGKSLQESISDGLERAEKKTKGRLGKTLGGPRGIIGGVIDAAKTQLYGTGLLSGSFGLGILGIALFGAQAEGKQRAYATRARSVLAQVETVTTDTILRTQDRANALRETLGISFDDAVQRIGSVTQAFAQAGIGIDALNRASGLGIAGIGDDVETAIIGLDSFFQSEGVFGDLLAEQITIGGAAADGLTDKIYDVTASLRGLGANVPKTVRELSSISSSLRFQRIGLDQLEAGYTSLAGTIARKFDVDTSTAEGRAFLNSRAASGLQGVAQGVTGLNPGLLAVLGQRMGLQGNAQDVALSLREDLTGDRFTKLVDELRKYTQELSPNRAVRVGFLESQGLSLEAATLIADSAESDAASLREELGKIAPDLKNALGLERAKLSPFERAQERFQLVVERIAKGVLNILAGIGEGIAALVYFGAEKLGIGGITDDDVDQQFNRAAGTLALGLTNFREGFTTAVSTAADLAEETRAIAGRRFSEADRARNVEAFAGAIRQSRIRTEGAYGGAEIGARMAAAKLLEESGVDAQSVIGGGPGGAQALKRAGYEDATDMSGGPQRYRKRLGGGMVVDAAVNALGEITFTFKQTTAGMPPTEPR